MPSPPVNPAERLSDETTQYIKDLKLALMTVTHDMLEVLDSMPVGEMQRGVWEAGVNMARAALAQETEL